LLSRRSLVIPAAGLRVDLAGASPWEPRPRPGRTSPHELARRARRARALTVAEGSSPSLLPLLWVSGSTDLPSEPARSAAPPAAVLRAAAGGAAERAGSEGRSVLPETQRSGSSDGELPSATVRARARRARRASSWGDVRPGRGRGSQGEAPARSTRSPAAGITRDRRLSK